MTADLKNVLEISEKLFKTGDPGLNHILKVSLVFKGEVTNTILQCPPPVPKNSLPKQLFLKPWFLITNGLS